MNFKLNKDKTISGYALRILLSHIPTFNPTYPLLSAIMVTLVEQLKKQDSDKDYIVAHSWSCSVSELGGE